MCRYKAAACTLRQQEPCSYKKILMPRTPSRLPPSLVPLRICRRVTAHSHRGPTYIPRDCTINPEIVRYTPSTRQNCFEATSKVYIHTVRPTTPAPLPPSPELTFRAAIPLLFMNVIGRKMPTDFPFTVTEQYSPCCFFVPSVAVTVIKKK